MQRIVSAITALALALSFLGSTAQPAAAVTGYDSAYFGESAFLTLAPGTTGQFVAIFTNTGPTGWVRGTASQVNLAVCLADKVTCNVASPNAAWASGWLSPTAYATTSTGYVGPGQQGFFVYSVTAPAGGGYARFNGDLSLVTGEMIHQQGYYQDAFSPAPAATAATLTSLNPTSGTSAGGTSVTITGTGFVCSPAPTVTVGGVVATITACSATSITFTTPAGSVGNANVVVTNTGAPASNALPYAYVDLTSPTLVSASGATGSNTITLTFSEPVYCSGAFPAVTATLTSVPVTVNTVTAIVCPNTPGTAGTTFTLTTSAPLAANTAYTVALTTSAVTGQVVDVAGNIMTSPASATFTNVDTTAPTITDARVTFNLLSTNIADIGDAFTLTFSERMTAATAATIQLTDQDGTVGTITCGGLLVAGAATCALDGTGTVMTVTLTAGILASALTVLTVPGTIPLLQIPVDVTATTLITDLAGNAPNLPGSADRRIDVEP